MEQPNRRSLSSMVIDSRALLRLSIPFLILLLADVIISIWICIKLDRLTEQIDAINPAATSAVLEVAHSVVWILTWGLLGFGFLCLGLWIVFSHRIFGPIVPIRRHLDRLAKGEFEGQVVLRKSDEFKSVADDLNRLTESLRNPRGQSLIQIMVTLAVTAVVFMSIMTMQSMQARENAALTEKIGANDVSRAVSSVLGSPACGLLFNQPGNVTSGSLTFTTSGSFPQTINLASVPMSATDNAIAMAHPQVSPMTNNLVLDPVKGIQVQVTSASSANLLVNFDQSRLVHPVHNLSFPFLLATTTAGSSSTIVGCQMAAALRYEGAQNVSGGTCPGTYAGGFCDNAFMKHITFSQPFKAVPQVMVSPRVDSIFTFCTCCQGAFDQIIASPLNITTTGFDAETSISPFGGDCLPYDNWSTEMAFDWMAIGY